MKTYVLEQISSIDEADKLLSKQSSPWLLLSTAGDPIAYFDVVETDLDIICPAVTADISGRHYNEEDAVIAILKSLQAEVGGTISCKP